MLVRADAVDLYGCRIPSDGGTSWLGQEFAAPQETDALDAARSWAREAMARGDVGAVHLRRPDPHRYDSPWRQVFIETVTPASHSQVGGLAPGAASRELATALMDTLGRPGGPGRPVRDFWLDGPAGLNKIVYDIWRQYQATNRLARERGGVLETAPSSYPLFVVSCDHLAVPAPGRSFSDALRAGLRRKGMPPGKVWFTHEASTPEQCDAVPREIGDPRNMAVLVADSVPLGPPVPGQSSSRQTSDTARKRGLGRRSGSRVPARQQSAAGRVARDPIARG